MPSINELPRPQKHYDSQEWETMVSVTIDILERISKENCICTEKVGIATNLGCGEGTDVNALLTVFPQAIVHAVDYFKQLDQSLLHNPRVVFHQGLFTEVLDLNQIPSSDIVLCKLMGYQHGFNDQTISLLAKVVDNGFLVAAGDNGEFEKTFWFRKYFSENPIKDINDDVTIWRVKNDFRLQN